MFVRRPLLRTAMVGGVAYSVGHHAATQSAQQASMDEQQNAQIAELQQQQTNMQQQPAAQPVYQQPAPSQVAAPEPVGDVADEIYEQLKKLEELRESGVLTDDEFNSAKQKVLSSI